MPFQKAGDYFVLCDSASAPAAAAAREGRRDAALGGLAVALVHVQAGAVHALDDHVVADAAGALKEEGEAKAEVFLKDAQERVEAATAMQKRRALLAAKGELVNEALKAAYQKLLNLPDEEYFAFLYRQLARQELKGNGELCLNQKDYARRPADFDAKVSAAAAEKGGTLRVSDQPAAIDGGFILSYGGIMENCSFEAVFESEADRMKDRIREVLFQN